MAPERPKPPAADPELAQAFHELAKGESTATTLETHLTALERKIDALLASVDVQDPPPLLTTNSGRNAKADGDEEEDVLVKMGDGEGLIRAGKEEA